MSTETVLTHEQRVSIEGECHLRYAIHREPLVKTAVELTEKAVLQSPEVQAWKRDAKRLDWLESCEDSHGFCHAGYGDYIYYAHQVTGMPSVREVIDAARENT